LIEESDGKEQGPFGFGFGFGFFPSQATNSKGFNFTICYCGVLLLRDKVLHPSGIEPRKILSKDIIISAFCFFLFPSSHHITTLIPGVMCKNI